MDVIFDIDGTLADLSHRVHLLDAKPKDWETFNSLAHKDKVIAELREVACSLANNGNTIIYLTGREDTPAFRAATTVWLENNNFPDGALYMRPFRDYREDPIVKSDLFLQTLEDGFAPQLVFEDRARVVAMWREKGLICCQVAPGDF